MTTPESITALQVAIATSITTMARKNAMVKMTNQ